MALFYYPTPKRMADRIPGISMEWCSATMGGESQCDNIGIQPWLLPDGKTAVMITDSPEMLIYDVETLETKGWLKWNSEDFETATTGATHCVEDITTGDMLGIMTMMKPGIKSEFTMNVYRIKADDINTRILIGKIPVGETLPYMHSFGHTADKIIFQDNSIGFSTAGMMEGKPMDNNFVFNWDKLLSFHVMDIETGHVDAYECDHPGYILHTGNSFIDSDGKLVTEAEMYVEAEVDPFKIMDRAWLLDPNREAHHVGARLRRYSIDLETKEITYKTLLQRDTDTIGFVMYNTRFAGKENRYTYVCTLDYNESITRLHRIDNTDGSDLTWEEPNVFISEPNLVLHPTKTGELDMVLMYSVYDHNKGVNRFVIIDAATMKTISDTDLPLRLPMTLHQYFYTQQ